MRVYIVAASDAERDPQRRLRWGDYWLKQGIARALTDAGHEVQEQLSSDTDVLVHCWGLPLERVPEWTFNVLYVHSHPADLDQVEWGFYDRVVAGSRKLDDQLRDRGVRVDGVIAGATDFERLDVPIEHDVVFVGNNRGGLRPIIRALGDLTTLPFRLEVWGEGWQMLPEGIWQGEYIPYDELNRLYASSAVVLSDTHTDMREAGIINPRVLDATAAGAMVIDEGTEDIRGAVLRAIEQRRAGWRPRDEVMPRYSDLAQVLCANIRPRLRVDLGCGRHKRPGFLGIDRLQLDGVDMVWDVRDGLPFGDGTVDYVVADNLMEHIGEDFIYLMNRLHRALRTGGRLTIIVPGVHAPVAAFSDPTHVRWFTPETWDYFDYGHPRWQEYGQNYGIRPWRVLRCEVRDRFIDVVLQPVKETAK